MNLACLLERATKFCTVVANFFSTVISFSLSYKNVSVLMHKVKATDNNEVHGSLQKYGSSKWNQLHVTPLAHRTWGVDPILLENLYTPGVYCMHGN